MKENVLFFFNPYVPRIRVSDDVSSSSTRYYNLAQLPARLRLFIEQQYFRFAFAPPHTHAQYLPRGGLALVLTALFDHIQSVRTACNSKMEAKVICISKITRKMAVARKQEYIARPSLRLYL